LFNDNGTDDNKILGKDIGSYTTDDMVLRITLTGTGNLTSNYKVVIFKDKIV
jgi:hypothetical protein